jgi:hypothetical protein
MNVFEMPVNISHVDRGAGELFRERKRLVLRIFFVVYLAPAHALPLCFQSVCIQHRRTYAHTHTYTHKLERSVRNGGGEFWGSFVGKGYRAVH